MRERWKPGNRTAHPQDDRKGQVLDKETGEYREIRYGDIVILLRSATGWSETFSQVLSSRGIPVYSASRTGYFSAQEVVTLLNYLRVCDNPLQDIPLTGVLYSPIVGCTAQELAMLRSECPDGRVYDSICAYVEKAEEISEENVEKLRLVQKLKLFLSQLTKFRDMAAYTPIHELILYILKDTGYGRYARAIPGGAQRGQICICWSKRQGNYEKPVTGDCLTLSVILKSFRNMRWISVKSIWQMQAAVLCRS